ncbi:putative sporulation protein YtxC [Cohnella hashimotonis]|uniref:Sporulation protein YtxC n=1 Tax=Cohnella hashimotonis TaxID=2826895 RepID=A0ABT6TCU8_9BACL|nr:putative sporulation protein YtxC [Cohnella hashimotonis]MDI4644658.1 putative sporulation protein YtxC [Cohnella hashimotonis]
MRSRLQRMMNDAFEGLADSAGQGPWRLAERGDAIVCGLDISAGQREFCDKIGMVLAEFVLAVKEPQALERFMQRRLGTRDQKEIKTGIREAIVLLNGELPDGEAGGPDAVAGEGRKRRLVKIAVKLGDYLWRNGSLHLDGFMRFRMREHAEELKEAAETAVEEMLMDRQYQEFMRLLQSMVKGQETGLPAIHVLHGGGQGPTLLDEKMRPLQDEPVTEPILQAASDQQDRESLLVTRLLAASPRRLYIHTDEPDAQVVRTLMGIFGERAAICDHPVPR